MSYDGLAKMLRLVDEYYRISKERDVLCTGSVDEIVRAVRAISELAEQGITDEEILSFVLRTSLVKLPECEQFYEEALRRVGVKGGD